MRRTQLIVAGTVIGTATDTFVGVESRPGFHVTEVRPTARTRAVATLARQLFGTPQQ